ncbi:hypothetical protein BpHYR1_045070 [Brachionus plicatilis]|uniref:Uncharacterized protein n=1 Tax=Brachionus plicatilis TaxID=10195 RepID=A0A3M7SLA3_BRAPC|nr:hypothetical protein BpHYR1_045070 [Brachionus plicatilis]
MYWGILIEEKTQIICKDFQNSAVGEKKLIHFVSSTEQFCMKFHNALVVYRWIGITRNHLLGCLTRSIKFIGINKRCDIRFYESIWWHKVIRAFEIVSTAQASYIYSDPIEKHPEALSLNRIEKLRCLFNKDIRVHKWQRRN